jgi:hypothetical protein
MMTSTPGHDEHSGVHAADQVQPGDLPDPDGPVSAASSPARMGSAFRRGCGVTLRRRVDAAWGGYFSMMRSPPKSAMISSLPPRAPT